MPLLPSLCPAFAPYSRLGPSAFSAGREEGRGREREGERQRQRQRQREGPLDAHLLLKRISLSMISKAQQVFSVGVYTLKIPFPATLSSKNTPSISLSSRPLSLRYISVQILIATQSWVTTASSGRKAATNCVYGKRSYLEGRIS